MAFLDSTPFVKEEYQVEYWGDGDLRSSRERITITVQYPCDSDGQSTETIPTTRNTTIQSPATVCDLQRVSVEVPYGSPTGLCTIIYENTTDWTIIGVS